MNPIETVLSKRILYLEKLRKEKHNSLMSAPEGSLRISVSGNNRVQYYYRNKNFQQKWSFIPKKQQCLAESLAQKDYDQRIAEAADEEIIFLQNCLKRYPAIRVEEVRAKMHPERKKLITPIEWDDEEYVDHWNSIQFEGNNDWPACESFVTDRGERVRSKSELIRSVSGTIRFRLLSSENRIRIQNRPEFDNTPPVRYHHD